MKKLSLLLLCLISLCSNSCQKPKTYDVCVYGATSAGVMAAYTAKMQGKSVVLLESGNHLGGLTSGGLGQTDIGNKYAITGLSRDFYRRIGAHYGKLEQWTFEPKVAKAIFQEYLDKADIQVRYLEELESVELKGQQISSIHTKNASTGALNKVSATVFIDCTYEGDLMAKAGVSYTVGREANSQYDETWNGVQMLEHHQFMDGIDPYVEKGKPQSGLLWGIREASLAPSGSGDTLVQAYNYRLCLTDSVENQVSIRRPNGYDSTKFELLLRYIEKKQSKELNWAHMHIQPMPNRKTDINNSGPFSTDFIGANHGYPEANYEERKKMMAEHKLYTESLLYFLGNDPRVPLHLREEMKKWGYPKDEFTESGHFTPQLYVREARRMVSDYVMTEKHCIGEEVVKDGIGIAAYTMDSHNCQRLVVNGMVKNEGDVQKGLGGLPPYPISYKSIIPKKSEVNNLIVPVCLSASHIAFGSIRMEPVFMVLGQSAGLAAAMSNGNVHQVDVAKLQEALITDPFSDGRLATITLDNDDENVRLNGQWKRNEKHWSRYGKSAVISESADAEISFQTDLQKLPYEVYGYFPGSAGDIKVILNNETETTVNPDKNHPDWIKIGEVSGEANPKFICKLKPEMADVEIVADALILIPQE
ncbi:FAD-dependent oxidoreductase [Jiulongibacter sp. NS-SX5]|uniref:FAD-dependent oxidoreductase n=1 Tax=Jiulongibacter sp. NS-SX5 TaxID=3463854 RepID=UPI0040597569